MGFFDRLSRGWDISISSYKVLLANKQLIIFPILSGLSMLLIAGSFITAVLAGYGWDFAALDHLDVTRGYTYLAIFGFYLVNYLIVVYFNMALMHCARLYFDGETPTIGKGLRFSNKRMGAIVSWAIFAATVGTILKAIQDNAGWLGKLVISLVGFAWGLATFFVIPILAYENVGPTEALKRSTDLMTKKWGERLGASFSLGLLPLLGMMIFGIGGAAISAAVNEGLGIMIFVFGMLATFAVTSAVKSIFISAVYSGISGNINDHFQQKMLDDLFVSKD